MGEQAIKKVRLRWGAGALAGDLERARDGKFRKSILCDCCGKPCGRDHMTDDEVCGGSDGPGFYICARVRCGKLVEGKTTEERREIYTARRAKNGNP